MTKQEILRELGADLIDLLDGTLTAEQFKERDSERYDRFALSVVKASVPEKIIFPPHQEAWTNGEYKKMAEYYENIGFNACRAQTLENAKKIIKT